MTRRQVARALGIPRRDLVRMERGGEARPARDEKRRYVYSAEEVARLRALLAANGRAVDERAPPLADEHAKGVGLRPGVAARRAGRGVTSRADDYRTPDSPQVAAARAQLELERLEAERERLRREQRVAAHAETVDQLVARMVDDGSVETRRFLSRRVRVALDELTDVELAVRGLAIAVEAYNVAFNEWLVVGGWASGS